MNAQPPATPAQVPVRAPHSGAGRVIAWLGATARGVVRALVSDSAAPEPLRYSNLLWRVWLPRGQGRSIDLIALADWVLALFVLVTVASYVETLDAACGDRFGVSLQWLVAFAHAFPLLLRRRWPLAAWRCSLLGLLLASPVLRPFFPLAAAAGGNLVHVLCLYTVATRCDREVAKGAFIASTGAYLLTELVNPSGLLDLGGLLQVAVINAVPLVYGHSVRVRRDAVAELALQERSYEEERAARAVLQERANIARELHDVVAHCMSVIAIQAGAAPLRSPEAPASVKEDLADIRRTATEALTEMRRVLGILRQEGADDTPHPDLGRIRDLAASAEAAGLAVSIDVATPSLPVSPGVSVSAYRIVQESLSNVMLHAPGAAVRVRVGFRESPPAVEIRVDNDPPPHGRPAPEGDRTGHGLVGMRERVTMLRGELRAEPTEEGGFRVAATLPVQPG